MAWTCVNCTGGHKVFEKFISTEILPAWTKWRQRQDEMKEGYQSSNSLRAGKQADRSIQQQTCYFSRQVKNNPEGNSEANGQRSQAQGGGAMSFLVPEGGAPLSFRGWNQRLSSKGQGPHFSGLREQGHYPSELRGPSIEPKRIVPKPQILMGLVLVGFRLAGDP